MQSFTPDERKWAEETVLLGLAGCVPQGEAAMDAFDQEFDLALEILYPEDSDESF